MIPLLAVLRSPLVGMTGDRLAEIRGLAEGTFTTALQAAGAQGWEDCRSFLGQLEALRFGAGEESSHHLLWSLYRQTDMLEVYSSLPGGESAGRIYSPSMNWPDGLRERDTKGSSAFSFIWTGYGRAGACRRCRPRPRRRPG